MILWADEAQRFVTASEDGISDYNSVDILREGNATLVAAAQSSTSFIPPLGEHKAKVLTLNLRNRMIFKAADEAGAIESADFLGQRSVIKRTWGFASGHYNRNYHRQQLDLCSLWIGAAKTFLEIRATARSIVIKPRVNNSPKLDTISFYRIRRHQNHYPKE